VVLAGSPATLTMYDARLTATAGPADNPKISGGTTPGHLTSEHLNPALTSFKTASAGEMCGNISAASLNAVSMPTALQGTNCSNVFATGTHHLLDAIVQGCSSLGQIILPTQPDGSTDGHQYMFTLTNNAVSGCTSNAGGAPWPTCLDKATYSSAFLFTADRVIGR
jgi:hypothetical protein